MFAKKLKPVPRSVPENFDGHPVKKLQFNPGGGFKITYLKDKSEHCAFVPNALGNRHYDYLRKWIAEGNFPEDPDPIKPIRYLGIPASIWIKINLFLICVGTLAAGLSGIYLALK